MELEVDKFIKDCNVTKEDWQTYLDRGTLEHIVSNMLMTYHQEQVKKLNIDDVSKCLHPYKKVISGDDGMYCTECDKYITTF